MHLSNYVYDRVSEVVGPDPKVDRKLVLDILIHKSILMYQRPYINVFCYLKASSETYECKRHLCNHSGLRFAKAL